MSCQKCENEPIRGAFYRWKNANVEIIACKEHWLEITEALNEAQKEKIEETILTKREIMEENLKRVILPEEVPREEYDRVINYLITIGFFKNWI